jgi:uncharacterized protein (TIGR00369 family)
MASIWFRPYTLDDIHAFNKGNMVTHVGIEFTEIGDNYLTGTMPVDNRTRQTMGILHGGASVVLAETLGSIAANLVVDPSFFACVGLDINANHIRAVQEGLVTGTARPLHLGGTTQVWGIEITDGKGRTVCVSRLTMAVLKLDKGGTVKNPLARP